MYLIFRFILFRSILHKLKFIYTFIFIMGQMHFSLFHPRGSETSKIIINTSGIYKYINTSRISNVFIKHKPSHLCLISIAYINPWKLAVHCIPRLRPMSFTASLVYNTPFMRCAVNSPQRSTLACYCQPSIAKNSSPSLKIQHSASVHKSRRGN